MKTYVCTVIDDMVYGGCLMKVNSSKIVIHFFFKKIIILFENIKSIIVFKNRLTLGIEYIDNSNINYIKVRMLKRKKLLSVLADKFENIEYR